MSEWVDFNTDEILFFVPNDGEDVLCRVTSNALQDFTRAGTTWTEEMSLKVFQDHRSEIEALAMRLLKRGEREEDGSVLITFARIEALSLVV